jgi:hypothetical protein
MIKDKLAKLLFPALVAEVERAEKVTYGQRADMKYAIEGVLVSRGVFNPQVTFDGKIEVEFGIGDRQRVELLPYLPDYISTKDTETINSNLNKIYINVITGYKG